MKKRQMKFDKKYNVKQIIFDIKIKIFKKKSLDLLKIIQDESLLSGEEKREIVFKRILALVHHAYENTEFYKKYYDSMDFKIQQLKSYDDINKIPILHKEDLVKYSAEIKVKQLEDKYLKKSVTGGSTGKPITVYHDARVGLEAFNWYYLKSLGLHPADNAAFLERYNPTKKWFGLINKIMWHPTKRVHLDIVNVNDKTLENFYIYCKKIKPKYIEGYVGAVEQFARFLLRKNLRLQGLHLVWTTSSPITDAIRNLIKEAFQCEVVDQYGCCEIYWLAGQFPGEEGLRVFDTFRQIDIIDSNRTLIKNNNITGDIIVTDLLNYAFPLIRYANGDRGSWLNSNYESSANVKCLNPIKGRVSDCIYLPKGGLIPGEFLTTLFDDFPESISKFKIHQDKMYVLHIYCVLNKYNNVISDFEEAKENIINKIKHHDLNVRFEIVEEIDHNKGKIQYIISDAKPVNI